MRVKELVRILTDASPDKGKTLHLYYDGNEAHIKPIEIEVGLVDSNETEVMITFYPDAEPLPAEGLLESEYTITEQP